MRRAIWLMIGWSMAPMGWAAPQFDLAVKLEPSEGRLAARAQVVVPANEALALRLAGRHRIESLQVDGASLRATVAQGWQRIDLPSAARERRIDIRWTIRAAAPDAAASHRDTLTAFEPQIGEAGSFLPAGGAWYPLPFDAAGPALHRFRLEVDLPASQRALASGDRVGDAVSNGRRIVRFDMTTDSEGADLMAGPWVEATRTIKSRNGRALTLATLFHPPIADQAEGYLDAAATHLARFESVLGDYPYSRFTIASSPTPTGFGMAGLTYLGIDVLRLPFIRHTSLPHEILHNWWGNGVYLSNEGGNWSEGLTTFMADYALREAQGEDAARAMRLDWLRGLSALSPQAHDSLARFGGRTHDASQVIGYHKAALVFVMLRDRLGAETFDRALRAFWLGHRHRRAGWNDLRAAFEKASGRPLDRFFSEWVEGRSLARPVIDAAVRRRDGLTLTLRQSSPAFALEVPVHVRSEGRTTVERVPLDDALGLTVLSGDERLSAAARALAESWPDRPPGDVGASAAPGRSARLVIGSMAAIDAWLAQHALPARTLDGDVVAWAQRAPAGGTLALVAARDADALSRASRSLPHYGAQGWVTLAQGRAAARGQWPATTEWRKVCAH